MEQIKEQVEKHLCNDQTGHNMDHIQRVLNLSLKFARKEQVNEELCALIALLHDVDDYKLVGEKQAEEFTNARKIMAECKISDEIQEQVIEALKSIGFSKRLKGIQPSSLEAQIVSDADMCDASGANGILRAYTYSMKKGMPFFDQKTFPARTIDAASYTHKTTTSVNHLFEKILKLKNMILTDAGREEFAARDQIVIDFLYHFFEEENAAQWSQYLKDYLENRSS